MAFAKDKDLTFHARHSRIGSGYRIVLKRNATLLYTLLLAAATSAFGAGASDAVIGRVMSSQPVTINGTNIPAQSVVSWPVSVSDEIATSSEGAMIQFKDGTTLSLQGNTTARVEPPTKMPAVPGQSNGVIVRVLKGIATPTFGPNSTMQMVTASGRTVTAVLPKSAVQPGAIAGGSSSTVIRGLIPTPGRPSAGFGAPATSSSTSISATLVPGGGSAPTIVLPNGTRLNLVVDPATNNYTVASISTPVTVNGAVVYTPASVSTAGLSNVVIQVTQPSATGTVSVTFSTPVTTGGTTTLTPFTPTQVSNLQTTLGTAEQNAATTAGGTAPSNKPITTGTFSPSAP